jgi:ADP-heptose:LPS heptosyltransferase
MVSELVNCSQWATWLSYGATITPYSRPGMPLDEGVKSVLIVRPGGFGDLLFMTPSLRELKRLKPELRISFASRMDCREVLQGNPDVEGFFPYPVPQAVADTFDCVMSMADVLEYSEGSTNTHCVDLYAREFGVTLPDDGKRLRMELCEEERAAIRSVFPRTWKTRIAIQLNASSPVRIYPRTHELLNLIATDKTEVVCIGRRGQDILIDSENPKLKIINTHGGRIPLSFRQSCALLTTCDVLIAPDSAMTHVADALDVPCVALYASFPASLRTAYAPKTVTVLPRPHLLQNPGKGADGKVLPPITCAPCFHHSRKSVMPEGCPGAKVDPKTNQPGTNCLALAAITPQDVVEAVKEQIAKYKKKFELAT